MATHSSILAWKIPWMAELGRLQSMGSLRVGHDWATSLSLFTCMHWRRKWQPAPVFLPGESQGRGSLVGCRLWGRTELDTTEVTYQQQQLIIYFMETVSAIISNKAPPYPGHISFLLCYLLGVLYFFVLFCFTFRFMVHFKLIFVRLVKYVSWLFFACGCCYSSTISWKYYLCSIILPLILHQRSVDYIYMSFFLGSLFWSIDLCVCSLINTILC